MGCKRSLDLEIELTLEALRIRWELWLKEKIRKRLYTSLLGAHQPLYLTGPAYGPNYQKWLLKIKDQFDPKFICHPPVPLAHDEFVDRAE